MRPLILALAILVSASAADSDMDSLTGNLDRSLARAVAIYYQATEALAERSPERAVEIRTQRDAALSSRGLVHLTPELSTPSQPVRQPTPGATAPTPAADPAAQVPAEPEPVVVTRQILARLFQGRASINRNGQLMLVYDFRSPTQARDFSFRNQDARMAGGTLTLGAMEELRHNARWTGPISIRTEVAYGAWAGPYLTLGGASLRGSSYNHWYIHLNEAKVGFDNNYRRTGDINAFRPLTLTLDERRSMLTYGLGSDGQPAAIAIGALNLRSMQLTIPGGSGGASLRGLSITGTLDQDWLREQLAD